jgi:hypothetical protein
MTIYNMLKALPAMGLPGGQKFFKLWHKGMGENFACLRRFCATLNI